MRSRHASSTEGNPTRGGCRRDPTGGVSSTETTTRVNPFLGTGQKLPPVRCSSSALFLSFSSASTPSSTGFWIHFFTVNRIRFGLEAPLMRSPPNNGETHFSSSSARKFVGLTWETPWCDLRDVVVRAKEKYIFFRTNPSSTMVASKLIFFFFP